MPSKVARAFPPGMRVADGPQRRESQAFLGNITIDYGPRELLGKFFPAALAAGEALGVTLTFGTLEELLEINERNRETWLPLVKVFDHRTGVTNDETFCFFARDRAGTVVATQAARLYVWPRTNLHEEAESLRLLYKDPERMRQPGEEIVVTAPSAASISGRAVFPGGVWIRPDHRGGMLSSLMPRVARAYAHTLWFSDFIFSLMHEKVVRGGLAERIGYRNVESDVIVRTQSWGEFRSKLIWMQPDYMFGELAGFLGLLGAEVDGVVHGGRAEQPARVVG